MELGWVENDNNKRKWYKKNEGTWEMREDGENS